MTALARKVAAINPPLRHPGPDIQPRVSAVATRLVPVRIPLDGTQPVEAAICAAFAGRSGFVELAELRCETLDYVVPAPSERADRLAWYSAPQRPSGAARIPQGYASVGVHRGRGMIHCHGIWELANGHKALGHLLGMDTLPEAGQVLSGFAFASAAFDRLPDLETNFELFTARGQDMDAPQAVCLTLRPNEDIPTACMTLCARLGWQSARVIGLGSLNGAGFADGGIMRDHISEFLVQRGAAGPDHAEIAVTVVDSAGDVFGGTLVTGQGCVSVTAEIVLLGES
ncbi:DUF296 domain-containing protein [Citreicella sp. C3M06]|uniref:PCC domain-containing protein n=1 Tax=Citreicella sp. C3M06 TaxID=2841564 RepID=UPI001C09D044|nr:DUF296 domain-containing protein [Citreicella sp. C3M06]MBU2960351.1 DUF296 domain-containing protein [Citreicella sp. C3M06]